MRAHLNFTQFTDEEIAWATKDDLNQFFQDITVDSASESDEGTVKRTANIAAPAATTYANINVIDETGAITVTQIPSKNSFDELKSKFETLLSSMKTAGQMTGD